MRLAPIDIGLACLSIHRQYVPCVKSINVCLMFWQLSTVPTSSNLESSPDCFLFKYSIFQPLYQMIYCLDLFSLYNKGQYLVTSQLQRAFFPKLVKKIIQNTMLKFPVCWNVILPMSWESVYLFLIWIIFELSKMKGWGPSQFLEKKLWFCLNYFVAEGAYNL